MIEDLPIISINAKILKFWSLILVHNYRRYVCLIPSIFLNISQLLDIFFAQEPLDLTIRNTYSLVLWFNAIIRAVYLIMNNRKLKEFMLNLQIMYYEIKKTDDMTRKRLDDTTKAARKMAILNLFSGMLTCMGFALYPLFTYQRGSIENIKQYIVVAIMLYMHVALPYGMTIPGIDKYAQPYYTIFYVFQMVITPMGCCMYIPFTSLIVAFMMFGTLIAHHLQNRVRLLKEDGDTNKIVELKIVWCVQYHLKLIRYTKKLNDLFTYIAMLELITFGATLCALLFLLNITKSFGQFFIVITYIVMILMQIFTLYWYANELSVQTSKVATAAYDASWLEFDIPSRKALVLIMLRAQKPLSIMVGNVYPMTMGVFQSVLNAAYSFFTILRRFYV